MAPIDHDFRDSALLELALTHSSTGRKPNNERLEFLGDAVLDLVVAETFYRAHPDLNEGALTEFKAEVVSRRSLAEAAKRLELHREVHLGPGLKPRGLPRSVLANIFEALLGAIYLDSGLEAARRYVETTLAHSLGQADRVEAPPNPKQELQQLSQKLWSRPPVYRILADLGRAHARAFLVAASCRDEQFPPAWGRTVKEAERWAAHEALLVLGEREGPP